MESLYNKRNIILLAMMYIYIYKIKKYKENICQ